MAFQFDPLTSLLPSASTPRRPLETNYVRNDDRRDDSSLRDIAAARANGAQDARQADEELSDFQKHLDDEETNSTRPRETAPQTDQSGSPEQTDDTHGFTVSQVATTTEAPKPQQGLSAAETDEMAATGPGKGVIVKAVANNGPGANDGASVLSDPDETEIDGSPVSADVSLAAGQTEGEPGTTSNDPDELPVSAPVEPASSSAATTPETEETGDSVETVANIPATPPSEEEPASDDVTVDAGPPIVPAPPGPVFNENAQKVEGSDRPGWGAEHAPLSERGALARDLKSANASTSSPQNSDGQTNAVADTGPATGSEDGPAIVEAPVPSTDPAAEAPVVETVVSTDSPEAPAVPVTPAPQDIETNVPESLDLALAAGNGSSEPRSDLSAGADKSGTPKPSTNQTASLETPLDPRTGRPANSPATPAASPTGVTNASASGQGVMPSPEEIELALAGMDKRGVRSANGLGETVSAARAKSRSSLVSTTGNSNAGSSSQGSGQSAAAAQASSPTIPQGPQSGQSPMALPAADLASLAGGTDPSMVRPATLEIDPATGALHLTGTGSAKVSAPNLSEVTLQFSRARMIQIPAKDIAIQIARHLSGGVNRFDIRITPPELGRIEIKLEISQSGKVSAHLVADKPETLELLQKDRATLEKALAEAGLDTDASSLEFSMREGNSDSDDTDFRNVGLEVANEASDETSTLHISDLADLEVSAYGFNIVRMRHLDISI